MSTYQLIVVFFTAELLFNSHTGSAQCIPYRPTQSGTLSELQCSTYFTPCHFVAIPTTLSLMTAENQLANVLSQLRPSLTTGQLQRQCLEAFLFVYCYQSYMACEKTASGAYAQGSGIICEEDCIQAISEDCDNQEWMYLTNVIDQFRANGLLELPSLWQLQECSNNSTDNQQSCHSFEEVSPEECIITTSPSVSTTTTSIPSSRQLSVGIIVAICIGGTLTLLLTVFLSCLFLCFLITSCRTSKTDEQPNITLNMPDDNSFGAINPAQKEELESITRHSSGTLMLRASTVHEALLDVNLSPRTTTLAKRIKTSSFLNLSPKQRLQQLEYPRGNICLVRDLWETNFGAVYVGEASGMEQGDVLTSVFVKSLRNQANSKLREQFHIEMTWASGFSHPNIITLLGVCMKEEPFYMMYEYLEYGSLKDFLQSISTMWFDFDRILNETGNTSFEEEGPNQSVFGVEDLTGMACQVADGMDYLAKKAFILKDLAARNCHVGTNLVIKIANFGLSYDRSSEDYCCIRSSKSKPVPLRWLAPETIRHNKVSVYSDIWSFGVLLWEIFSFGTRPYHELSDAAVVQSVLSGCVLARPEKCPQGVYKIMLQCWSTTPSKRPWFHTIRPELAEVPREMGPEKRKSYGHAPSTPEIARALKIRYES